VLSIAIARCQNSHAEMKCLHDIFKAKAEADCEAGISQKDDEADNDLAQNKTGSVFLQSVSKACYAEPCINYGRVVRLSVMSAVPLSVCPYVTRWHCVKTTQAMIAKSSPTDSPRTATNCSSRARELNESGLGKIRNFHPITRRISETVQGRTEVTINDYRKSHTRFRLVSNQRRMTLNITHSIAQNVHRSEPATKT